MLTILKVSITSLLHDIVGISLACLDGHKLKALLQAQPCVVGVPGSGKSMSLVTNINSNDVLTAMNRGAIDSLKGKTEGTKAMVVSFE